MMEAAAETPESRLKELQTRLAEPIGSAEAAEAVLALARRVTLAGIAIPPETAAVLQTIQERQERRERRLLQRQCFGMLLAALTVSALLGYGLVKLAQSRAQACRMAQWERALAAADFRAAEAALAAEPDPVLKPLLQSRLQTAQAAEAARRVEQTERINRARALLASGGASATERALALRQAETQARTPEERRQAAELLRSWSKMRADRAAAERERANRLLQSLLNQRRELEHTLAGNAGDPEPLYRRYCSALTAALAAVPPGRGREPLMALFKELPDVTRRVAMRAIQRRK